jgi:diguanylate cyclase (GGDEF)-like protein
MTMMRLPRWDSGALRARLPSGRTGLWAGVAALCIAAGVMASLLGARDVARHEDSKARAAFPRAAAGIASALKLALQHEEDLLISGSTFFAGSPSASAGELERWVKWAQALRRYPELQKLGLVTRVAPSELGAFEARVTGRTVTQLSPGGKSSTTTSLSSRLQSSPRTELHIVPAGTRALYCLTAVELTRKPLTRGRPGLDQCALTPGLLASRDSGASVYAQAAAGRSRGFAIDTPVYHGNLPPSGFTNRRQAFVGWLREVLVPEAMLQRVLQSYPGYAVRLRHMTGSSHVVFTSGSSQRGAQSAVGGLQRGWTMRSFGPPLPASGVFAHEGALGVLAGGSAMSVLVGLLVFLLGAGRRPARVARKRTPPPDPLYDALTGLPNQALMLDRADRMLARAGRQPGLLVGALFIDIDWFKDINTKLGQDAGDQLLTIVASRLNRVVRAHDTVGRLGGDEFVILLETAARGARLDSLARRVIEALHEPAELIGFGPSFTLTASIGIAFGRYDSADGLLRDAQLALYSAQAAGRDRYTLFNANMRTVIEGHAVLEAELNLALREGQFFLLYQPIYDLTNGRVVGLEALIRWMHPQQGVLSPDAFIQLAEETALIVPIGRWVLEEACNRAAAWNVAGHRAGISVQVAASQLNRDGFVTDVRRALQQSGLEPSLLTLEVAERFVMRDVPAAALRFEELKLLGVRIALDDFGSDFANQADLQKMPLDFLKVDRSALAASDDEEYRSWLFQTILVLGRDLSLPVIAKEVETFEQLDALQALGCSMAQGFLIGKPALIEDVVGVINTPLPTPPAVPLSAPQEAPPPGEDSPAGPSAA